MIAMKDVKMTREQLYSLMWKEPVSSVAKRLGITELIIRKACKEMQIPLPYNGYWGKMKFGKEVIPEELPSGYRGKGIVNFSSDKSRNEEELSFARPIDILRKEIERDKRLNLVVPKQLTNPDILIQDVKKHWDSPEKFGYPNSVFPSGLNNINMRLSTHTVERSLRIMDTIIKALKTRGHRIIVREKKTYVVVDQQEVEINFGEVMRKKMVGDSVRKEHSGVLLFTVGYNWSKIWKTNKAPLERQISTILAAIELEGKRLKELHDEINEYHAQREAEQRIADEIKARKEKELEDFKLLFKKAERHDKAQIIRNYINEYEKLVIARNRLTNEIKEHFEWARKKADWYDPYIEGVDELLQGIDKESISF
jgi:hypothetical protein